MKEEKTAVVLLSGESIALGDDFLKTASAAAVRIFLKRSGFSKNPSFLWAGTLSEKQEKLLQRTSRDCPEDIRIEKRKKIFLICTIAGRAAVREALGEDEKLLAAGREDLLELAFGKRR